MRYPVGWMALLGMMWACAPSDSASDADAPPEAEAGSGPTVVVLETTMGDIALELDQERAPETVRNYLRYVRGGFYNGLTFHRVRQGFMIQAGALTPDRQRRTSRDAFPVVNEAENGLKNERGTLAMARTGDPHSATSEFFINLVDNTMLDFTERTAEGWGYAVFGRVIEGMNVVDAIAEVPVERWRQYEAVPLEPIVIERAYVR